MQTYPHYVHAMYILSALSSIMVLLGAMLRGSQSVWRPQDALWKNCIQGWLCILVAQLLLLTTVHGVIVVVFMACVITLLVYYVRGAQRAPSVYVLLARENIGLFALLFLLQTFLASYIAFKGEGMLDFSVEASSVCIMYTLMLLYVCMRKPAIIWDNPAVKDSFYRGWYYALFAWVLAYYGVEILLLSACVLSWLGTVLLLRYRGSSPPIAYVMARENIVFITFFWLVRSFFYQPFVVPTGSLEPSIYPGDFVLVNQYAYGLRFPVWGWKMYDVGSPQRGDIVVFRFPPQPNILYVKRVIGLPGDHILYSHDTLTINGQAVEKKFLSPDTTAEAADPVVRYCEALPGAHHDIFTSTEDVHRYRSWEWRVPDGQYLMLGDNRQASNDSRFWGFVPEQLIVGKVEYVIVSVDKRDLTQIKLRSKRFLKNAYTSD